VGFHAVACLTLYDVAGLRHAGEDGLEERGSTALRAAVVPDSFAAQDGGLGASVRGPVEPIAVVIKRTREGLGCAADAPPASTAAASGSACEAMLKDFRSKLATARACQAALFALSALFALFALFALIASPTRNVSFFSLGCLISAAGRVAERRRRFRTVFRSYLLPGKHSRQATHHCCRLTPCFVS
jgi:hypothetical protein